MEHARFRLANGALFLPFLTPSLMGVVGPGVGPKTSSRLQLAAAYIAFRFVFARAVVVIIIIIVLLSDWLWELAGRISVRKGR